MSLIRVAPGLRGMFGFALALATVVQAPAVAQTAPGATVTAPPATQTVPHLMLSLGDALAIAKKNNLQYQVATQDVRAAQARVVQAASALFPTLTLNYAYLHRQSETALTIPFPDGRGGVVEQRFPLLTTDTNVADAVLQYVIYNGGVNRLNVGVAATGYSAAQSELQAAGDDVQRDVTVAYFTLVQAREESAVADEAVRVADQNVATSQRLFAAGTVARADILRQQVSFAAARSRQIAAHNGVSLANAALSNLLNVDLSTVIDATDGLETAPVDVDLDRALGTARTLRAELRTAASAVEIARRTLSSAHAGYLPTVALNVAEENVKPNFLGTPQPQLTATLFATWRLFDGGLTRGKVQEADAQVAKAQLNVSQLRNTIDLEVRQAFFDYEAARSQVESARAAVAASGEDLRLSRDRYAGGAGTALESADALLADSQARVSLIEGFVSLRTSFARLQRAVGGTVPTGNVSSGGTP